MEIFDVENKHERVQLEFIAKNCKQQFLLRLVQGKFKVLLFGRTFFCYKVATAKASFK
jgi:hypothetical protein